MPLRASILSSRWPPGALSETPRAHFGCLGGDVGGPGGLLEGPRARFGALGAASGPLGSAPGTVWDHFGSFLGWILEYLFRVRW